MTKWRGVVKLGDFYWNANGVTEDLVPVRGLAEVFHDRDVALKVASKLDGGRVVRIRTRREREQDERDRRIALEAVEEAKREAVRDSERHHIARWLALWARVYRPLTHVPEARLLAAILAQASERIRNNNLSSTWEDPLTKGR